MNEKLLKNILRVVHLKYPFIIDLEYKKDIAIARWSYERKHNFFFIIDLELLRDMFPKYTIDFDFIKRGMLMNPMFVFNEAAGGNDVSEYGGEVNRIIDVLVQSVVKYDEEYAAVYKVKTLDIPFLDICG